MAPWPSDHGVSSSILPIPGRGHRDLRDIRDMIVANCSSYLLTATANGVDPEAALESAATGGSGSDPKEQQSQDGQDAGRGNLSLDEFQIIKAVVLGIVTSIILLSICKMVFGLFVRYAGKADDR